MNAVAAVAAEPYDLAPATERRPPLLYLCHRIPYPPNKGDKIRAWHLLKYLAERYDVYLGTFIDDPDDWQYAPQLRQLCADAYFAPLRPRLARAGSARGLVSGEPLTLPYYASRGLRRWADAVSRSASIQRRVIFSSVMGQFLPDGEDSCRTIADFVDVDSDKWRQYADSRTGPAAWIYGREAQLLACYERDLAQRCDATLFVSEAEASFFEKHVAAPGTHCGAFSNGVDAEFFDPGAALPEAETPPPAGPELVFTGAMDYWPNVDAVCWFAREVLPSLRETVPSLHLTIVGCKPAPAVQDLAAHPGIAVTGRVSDVRPYLARALAAIAPMRVARGVQNKVLEAMAMGKPALVSPMGLEGIEAVDGDTVLVAEAPHDYAVALKKLIAGEARGVGERARQLVLSRYAWESCLAPLGELLEAER